MTIIVRDGNTYIKVPVIPGETAYEIAVEHGYQGTEQEWLESLKGSYIPSSNVDVFRYKGSVSTYGDLPTEGMKVGDVWNIETADVEHDIKAGDNVAWNGTTWDVLSGTVDLSGYQTKIDSAHKLDADLVDDANSTHKFVSTNDMNVWNAKYDKPIDGIPKTDLSDAVQTSLGKADTAIQDISGKLDKTQVQTTTSTTLGDVYDVTYINTMLGDIETILTTLTTGGGVE